LLNRIQKSKNAFCHLLGNSGTITIRVLCRQVRNLRSAIFQAI